MTAPHGTARVSPRCGPRRRWLPGVSAGFTLVELVLACVVGCLVLAGAWSWLFTSASAGTRDARRLEVETSLAFVQRLTCAELRRATVFLASPAPGCSAHSIVFAVLKSDGSTETISYVWNPATQVLWRKAAGSHLASAVTGFMVDYLDDAGVEVASASGVLSQAELAKVRRLRLTIALACGDGELGASWDVAPRAAR